MARSTLAVQDLAITGTVPTFTAVPGAGAGNGFEVVADPSHRTVLVINNQNGSSIVVTGLTPGTVDGLGIGERLITVLTTETEYLPVRRVHKQSDGNAYFDFDISASVTCAAIKTTAE